jgi:hypothetical protein
VRDLAGTRGTAIVPYITDDYGTVAGSIIYLVSCTCATMVIGDINALSRSLWHGNAHHALQRLVTLIEVVERRPPR